MTLPLRPCPRCKCRVHPALYPVGSTICGNCAEEVRWLRGVPQKPFAPAEPLVFRVERDGYRKGQK
jgi:hypothetical protein